MFYLLFVISLRSSVAGPLLVVHVPQHGDSVTGRDKSIHLSLTLEAQTLLGVEVGESTDITGCGVRKWDEGYMLGIVSGTRVTC